MEEKKKFDGNAFIGILLIGAIILYMMYNNQKQQSEAENNVPDTAETDSISTPNTIDTTAQKEVADYNKAANDSITKANQAKNLGSFAYSASLPSATDKTTTLENNVLKIKVSNKGGQIVEARLKKMFTHDSLPIYLIKDGNAEFNLSFLTTDNRKLNTKDLYFEPSLSKNGGNTILSMKLKTSEDNYLEYVYTLQPDNYMLGFAIRSHGLKNAVSIGQPVEMNWDMKAYAYDKSISFENRYTESIWHYEGNKNDNSGVRNKTYNPEDVAWVAYRQHFFSSILLTDKNFDKAKVETTDLTKDEDDNNDEFTKSFATTIPLNFKGGELNEDMNLFYGPSDINLLKKYDRHLDEVIPMGWGIFGWINKYLFIPLLSFFMKYFSAGIAIIILTIIVKICLSPVQYKQYLAQAKRKIIQPEVDAIREKYGDNKMKIQQETMKLNRKAGISMTSGCIVGLIQAPIFYALFRLFPGAFNLRHKSFLWADDLSNYDSVLDLPFKIPFYGDHVSLFALLAAIAIGVYMILNMGGQSMPKQPGMPNMKFIMYLSPIFMLMFFNSYPSGMSVYYLTSNLISIGIVLVIKKVIIDENKVHAQIQENKKKPVKQGRFQRRMQEMMEEAQKQQDAKKGGR